MLASKSLPALLCLIVVASLLVDDALSWRRRRRRRCSPVNCVYNYWGSWSTCYSFSTTKYRYRYQKTAASCGGNCNINNKDSACCSKDCVANNWGSWGSCTSTCGNSVASKMRSRSLSQAASCGGLCNLNLKEKTQCPINCCPVNCAVASWGSWGTNCPCGTSATQYRYRTVSRAAACGGSSCPSTTDKRGKSCPCCKADCQGTWSSWGSCPASCGSQGTRSRSFTVTSSPSCGGSACPSSPQSQICTGTSSRNCQMNSWASGSCTPTNGKCGSGTMYRYRSVAVNAGCGGSGCPSTTSQAVACSAGCCPVNCAVTSWGNWGSCSNDCGTGKKTRSRSVSTHNSCSGSACPALSESTSCSVYASRPCTVNAWSSWSQCTNQCGAGKTTRTRTVSKAAYCGGACSSLSETKDCTSYASSRDCAVNAWGGWTTCSQKCAVGKTYRYRTVSQSAVCTGSACPALSNSKDCGTSNGGCQHVCTSGACSCNGGYLLNSDSKTCRPRDCSQPSASFCPSGKPYGSSCLYPTFTCTGGTTYGKTCTLSCKSGFNLQNGGATIQCQSSGSWTPYSTRYCLQGDKKPTNILLSNNKLKENSRVGVVVGALTTVDPNLDDTHSYTLIDSASGKFSLVSGNSIAASATFNFEVPPTSYNVKVRTTDNKGLSFEKTFTIDIQDVNEKPTGITLTNAYVNENSAKGTAVGTMKTSDVDAGQSYSYTLLTNPGGRFAVSGSTLQVGVSNTRCLAEGGSQCLLDYESKKNFDIKLRSVDSGSPPLSVDVSFTINLRDVNDQPRNLKLSGYTLKEDAAINTVIGALTATDEDPSQTLTYSLSDDAGRRFGLNSANQVVRKASSDLIDYETTISYKITAVATDSGRSPMKISKVFTIEILNVNEAPAKMDFTSTGGQSAFTVNNPSVRENSAKGTQVGTIVALDADANAKLAFRLDDSAGNRFSLKTSATTCTAVNVKNMKTQCTVPVLVNGVLNHEADALHAVVVRATDQAGLFKTARFSINVADVNDKPRAIVFSGGAQPSVNENENDKAMGSFTTTDEDSGDTHSYKLVDSAGGLFVLKGATLMTALKANLNFEVKSSYSITVRSTDSGSPAQSFEKVYTVQVKDVNEVPTDASLSANKIAENSGLNTVVGSLSTTDPDNLKSPRQTFTYALKDDAGGRFKVDGSVVKVALSNVACLRDGGAACKINYEAAKSYTIVVQVKDSGSPAQTADFSLKIDVTNANDQPRDLQIDNFKVKENAAKNAVVGKFSATDEDGQSLTYSLSDSDGGLFALLNGNQLVKAKSIDYETKTAHFVTVVVTDSGSPFLNTLSMTKKFTIEVLDVNEAPVTIIFKDQGGQLSFSDNSPRINENSALKTAVGLVEGHDEDAAQTLTFTLDDNAGGLFQVASSAICKASSVIPGVKTVCTAAVTVAGVLNYESASKHSIIVRATDKGGKFVATRFTIAVIDVNDKPSAIQLAGGSPEAVENKNNVLVGGLVTTDDDASQTHTYKLLNNAGGRFVVSGSQIWVSKSANLDYESAAKHDIVVEATDNGSPKQSTSATFTVRVIDVNEKPTSIGIDSDTLKENSDADTIVGKLSTVDPDNSHGVRQTFKYTLIDGASGRFKIAGDVVKVKPSNVQCLAVGGKECDLNYEESTQHDIVIKSTDSGSAPMDVEYTLTIRLTNVNDRPRGLDLSGDEVFENADVGTVVGKFTSNDEDTSQTTKYVLLDDDNGQFKIVGSELQKAKKANYETSKSHSVRVQAIDNGVPALDQIKTFIIDVLDVNEAPISINITDENGQLNFADGQPGVEELSPVGTIVGKIVALDYDAKETLAFKLDDDAGGKFALSGQPTCKTITDKPGINTMCWTTLSVNGDVDFEDDAFHYIIVRATDSQKLFFTQRFKVEIVNVNDVPHDIKLSVDEIKENLNDHMIGSFTTDDQDKAHSHTYRLVDNAGGRFVLKNNADLYTAPNANLDFEAVNEFNITVRSTDDGKPPLFREETFLITVIDVNEKPTSIAVSNLTVAENSPISTGIGSITVVDPDNLGSAGAWQTHTCEAIGNADGRFIVKSNALQVATANLNYEVNASWPIQLRCTDSGKPSESKVTDFVVIVTDVDEPPDGLFLVNGTVEENRSAGQIAGIFSTSDPDNEVSDRQSFTYTLENAPADFPFKFSGNKLVTTRALDFEANPSWKVDVRSTDDAGLWIADTFQIVVIDLNDAPTAVQLAGSSSTPENSAGGTYVGTLNAEDEDAKDSHTFRIDAVYPGSKVLSADRAVSGLFEVGAVSGSVTVADGAVLDYEAVEEYTVEVTTVDSSNLSFTGSVTVNISDVNEKPTNISLSNSQVDENSDDGTVIGELTVLDPDNEVKDRQEHTCVVLNKDEPFDIANKTILVVAGELNYEQESNHTIGIRCQDDGVPVKHLDRQFAIDVNNLNEAPIDVGLTKYTVKENLNPDTPVGSPTSLDPDNEVEWLQNVTYVFNDDQAPFVLNGSTVFTTATFDYEKKSSYVVGMTATDTGVPAASTSKQITINITDVNDPPTEILFNSSGIVEDAVGLTLIGVFETIDEDAGQTHTYKIAKDGVSEKLFFIDGNQLMLASGSDLDYEKESVYMMSIETTDSGNPPISYQGNITVHVLDVNEKPTSISLEHVNEIAENTPSGSFIANATVIDEDANQMHTCELINGSQYFTINRKSNPEIVVADDADIDYESVTLIHVTIRCTDDGKPPLSLDTSFDVRVTDVNEPPSEIVFTGTRFVCEDAPVGTVVGTVAAIDPDRGQSHVFKLTGSLADAFQINNDFREISVSKTFRLDFERLDENEPFVNISIVATDDGVPPLHYTTRLSFIVIDIDEPPRNITIVGGGDIFENATAGDSVGTLDAVDPENPNATITYEIISVNGDVDMSQFYLVSNSSGTFLFLNSSVDYENASSFSIKIRASDDSDPPASSETTVVVKVKPTDPCSLNTAGCDANAKCTRTGPQSARCDCNVGYTGNGRKCREIDHCRDTKVDPGETLCNNGTCVDGIDTYTCSCHPGFSPPNCRRPIDECTSNPCTSNGNCVDEHDGFSCVCLEGYAGSLCEVDIDDCASSPCARGTCIDGIAAFTCQCPPTYFGATCAFTTRACGDGSKCKQSSCVPKSLQAKVVQITEDSGDLVPIAINEGDGGNTEGGGTTKRDTESNTPSEGDEESNGYLCVPDDHVVTLSFPSDSADLKLFEEMVEGYLTNELYVVIPDPDNPTSEIKAGVSFVFVLKSSLLGDESRRKRRDAVIRIQVHFVAVLNDEPVPVVSVLKGLKLLCERGALEDEFGPHANRTCMSVSSQLGSDTHIGNVTPTSGGDPGELGRPESTMDFWPIVAAVGGIALLILTVMVTLIYVRKRQKRRRLERAKNAFPWEDEQTFGRRGEYSFANESIAARQNPVYDVHRFGEEELPEGRNEDGGGMMFSNPVYETEQGARFGGVENAIYEKQEDGGERIYEELNERL